MIVITIVIILNKIHLLHNIGNILPLTHKKKCISIKGTLANIHYTPTIDLSNIFSSLRNTSVVSYQSE